MFVEGALKIELHRGSHVTVLDVQYDRALIGSGAHCDVRLAPDEAAVEQLMVEVVSDDEVYVRTRTLEPPCLLNGAPFLEGRLAPTSMIELGSLAICVERVARQGQANAGKHNNASTSPAIQALGIVGVAIGLYVLLSEPAPIRSALSSVVEPPRSAAVQPQHCPQTDPLAALSLAQQASTEADSMRERAPFYPGDGLAAIAVYERAASCFAVARQADEAAAAHEAALTLHTQVADEIHLSHVRLERFLTQNKYDEARQQAQLLAALVPDRQAPYAQWLSAVMREGEMRSNGKKR